MDTSSLILDDHKLLWHAERVQAWLDGERIAPVTIDCALTRACGYNCVYCYGKLQANTIQHLGEKEIFDFLDDAAEIGVKAVSLVSDGESTCSPHLYAAIIHGAENGLDMALGTNGHLLEKDRLPEILPHLTYLRFNISAGEAKRYGEIHGCPPDNFEHVCSIIRECCALKKKNGLDVTIGLQMVLLPQFRDQVLPLARLGKELQVDYLVIKHCSDDERGSLGVDYDRYFELTELLKQAEGLSQGTYQVRAKWSKILSGGKRDYSRCYGPPFILQLSGSGLVAPCGMLFHSRYKKFHIGNIAETRFRDIWRGARYWQVMELIASPAFDARTMCGSLCLQHKVNEYLWQIKHGGLPVQTADRPFPPHVNFI